MSKIAVIGHFAFGKKMFDGQTVKTKTLTEALKKHLGEKNVSCLDTHGGAKKMFKLIMAVPSLLRHNTDVIMLPAHNGVLVFTPVLSFFNKFAGKKLHYVVIGGWLPGYLDKHKFTAKLLRKNFEGIYVETSVMKNELYKRGFTNVSIFPNYKDMDIIPEKDIKSVKEHPVKTCTFSRIIEKKGIADAINAVTEINENAATTVITLDIYGSIDESYRETFEKMVNASQKYIRYKGEVEPQDALNVLKNYDLQLFPTKFKTEGIPGSVVEGFFAGVPVVAAKWNSFSDVVDEGVTGIGFEIENYDDFKDRLKRIVSDYEMINHMKFNCLNAAKKYKDNSLKSIRSFFA